MDALAQQIRNMWVSEYRDLELRTKGISSGWGATRITQWDGGTTANGRTYTNVWPKIAAFVRENNLNPAVLVRAMFYEKPLPPSPNQAHGNYGLAHYQAYIAPASYLARKTELIHAFEAQKQKALAEVFSKVNYYKLAEQKAWQITLSDETTSLTPLFRYCVAKNQGWNELAIEFEKRAKKQYSQQAELYDEVWNDWIPTDLKEAVNEKQSANST